MDQFLSDILPVALWEVLFVFTRIGAAIMVFPGYGEFYVTPRIRLTIAGMMAVLLTPPLTDFIPAQPTGVGDLMLVLGGEIIVGVFIGLIAQVLLSTVTTAGTIIAFQSGFANAFVFNPASAQQSSIISAFLISAALTLIFVTDMHHLMLAAVVESYALFPPGGLPPVQDFTDTLAQTIQGSFVMAMKLSAPFIFAGIIFYLGVGLLSRLLPTIQVFFVALPIQVVMAIIVFMASISGMMFVFMDYFERGLEIFVTP